MAVPVGGSAGRRAVRSADGGEDLPARHCARESRADESRCPPDRPTRPTDDRVNILLVDDQPANLIALEAMLQGLGQNLIMADSGREALKWLLTDDFAVILLDVKMPEMDGFETADADPGAGQVTPHPDPLPHRRRQSQTQAVRGYAVGAVDYLVKPVVPEFVRSKVAVFVELAKKTELLRRQAKLLAAERAGGAGAGRGQGRAGAGPGAQEPRAGELQLRGLPRPAGTAPADRQLQPGGARESGRPAGRGRAPLSGAGARGQPAHVSADRRRAVSVPGHPGRAAGAGGGPQRARRRCSLDRLQEASRTERSRRRSVPA